MPLTGRQLKPWALSLPAAALLAGSSGVVLQRWAILVWVATLGCVLVAGLARGLRWSTQLSWLAGLLLWAAADALLRPVLPQAAAAAIATGVVVLVVLLLAQDPWVRVGAHPALALAGATAAAWLLAERLLLTGRPGGPFGNPDLAATVAVLALAVVPGLAIPTPATLAVSTVLLGGIVASGSRAAMLAVLAVAAAWVSARSDRRVRLGVAGLLLVGTAGLAMRLASDRDPLRYERLRLWQVALRTTVAELPSGSGPGGYLDAVLPHNFPRRGEFAHYYRVPGAAENDLLQLAATLGVPGLLFGGGLFALTVSSLVRRGAVGRGVLAAILVTSAFHAHLGFPAVAWPAALAVAGAGRPLPGRRCRASVPAAVATAVAVLLPTSVALGLGGGGGVDMAAPPVSPARIAAAMGSDDALAEVEVALWRACTARPRSAQAWRMLGAVRLARGELRRDAGLVAAASQAFATARAANPLDVLAMYGAAHAADLMGQPGAAIGALAAAVAVEPNFVGAWLELARLHLGQGDLQGAAQALERAEEALALARRTRFMSDYERALAAVDPALLRAVRRGVAGP